MKDTRIAYGAMCLWWDSVSKAGSTATHPAHKEDNARMQRKKPSMAKALKHGLPCCPTCGGMLYEVANEAGFMAGAKQYEAAGHPGYRAFLRWQRGKCFPDMEAAVGAYRAQGGMYALRPEGGA